MSKTHQSALGELVIAFNALEEALTIGLCELTPLDYPSAAIVFGSTSFKHKCKIISGIAHRNHERKSDLDNLKILLKQSSNIEESRNRLLHSDWTLHQTQSGVERRREKIRYTRNAPDFVNERYEVDDILKIVDQCLDCVTLLEYLFVQGDFSWWSKELPWGLKHKNKG